MDKDLPDYAVIDESFFETLLVGVGNKAKPIPLSEIKGASWPEQLVTALLCAHKDHPLLSYLREKLGEDEAIDLIDAALAEATSESSPKIIGLPKEEQLEVASHLKEKSRLNKLLEVMRQELLTGRAIAHGIVVNDHGIELRYRKAVLCF